MLRNPFISLSLFVLLVVVFFVAYNFYMVDASIENLQMSLTQTAYAQSVEGVKSMRYFMDDLLMDELSKKKIDEKRLAELDFSEGVMSEAQDFRQIRDVRFVLQKQLVEKKKERNALLRLFDKVRAQVLKWFGRKAVPIQKKKRIPPLPATEKARLRDAERADKALDFANAVRLYQEFIEKNSEYEELSFVRLALGHTHMKARKFDEAKRIFAEIQKQEAGKGSAQVAQILQEKLEAKWELLKKRNQLKQKADETKEPKTAQPLYLELGVAEKRLFLYEEAEASLKKASELVPKNALAEKALFLLGLTYKSHLRYDEAGGVFHDFVSRFPESSLLVSARYQLADSLERSGFYEKAAQAFEQLAEEFASNPLAALSQFHAAYNYNYYSKDPIKAAKAFRSLNEDFEANIFNLYSQVEMRPRNAYGLLLYGFKKLQANKFAEAEASFREALLYEESKAWAHSALGIVLGLQRQMEPGLIAAKTGLELNEDEYAVSAMGYFFEVKREYENAISWYLKALDMDPEYLLVRKKLAKVYENTRQYDLSIAEYREIIERQPDSGAAYNDLGHAYSLKGDYDQAITCFEKARELDPDLVEAHYNLGLFYSAMRRTEEAQQAFETVLRLDPKFKAAQTRLDALLAKEG